MINARGSKVQRSRFNVPAHTLNFEPFGYAQDRPGTLNSETPVSRDGAKHALSDVEENAKEDE